MKTTTLKALALSMLLTLGLAMPMAAQSDGFFRSNNDNYVNRDGEGLQNETFGVNGSGGLLVPTHINAPLGNGLLIMMAAGAGYALSRRRRTRKGVTLLLAAAMLLGMTQCKKKVDTISSVDAGDVFITLNPANNSKYEITLGAGSAVVNYTEGDKIHVGCDGKYVGTLTHDGDYFSGSIANPKEGSDLYFYFVSGLLDETKMSSSITSYNVNISDQSAQLPILSCGVSTKPYTKGKTSYTSLLCNKVALVRFQRTDDKPTADDVTVFNMQSEATIDFANHTITPTGKKNLMKLNNPSGESSIYRWGILLPGNYPNQSGGLAKIGANWAVYHFYGIPSGVINANGMYEIGNIYADEDGHGFTVDGEGNAVVFSKGNLQYKPAQKAWQFASSQYDIVGSGNANISSTYDGWIDLFGWGTWGSDGNPVNTSTNASDYSWTGDFNGTIAEYNKYNSQWRTLTKDEWNFILNGRSDSKRFLRTRVMVQQNVYVYGLFIYPDGFTEEAGYALPDAYYNDPSHVYMYQDDDYVKGLISQWGPGVVFLPYTGSRTGTNVVNVDKYGGYWSSTPHSDGTANSIIFYQDGTTLGMNTNRDDGNYVGQAVRLVIQ